LSAINDVDFQAVRCWVRETHCSQAHPQCSCDSNLTNKWLYGILGGMRWHGDVHLGW